MPIGGETIGTAYIRILADGSGLSDDIKDEFRDVPDMMESEGQKGTKAYYAGANAEFKKWRPDEEIQRALQRGKGRFDAEGQLIGSGILAGIKSELEDSFGDIGVVIGKNLQDELESGKLDFSGLTRRLRNIRPDVARAIKDITDKPMQDLRLLRGEFNLLAGSVVRYQHSLVASEPERRELVAHLHDIELALQRAGGDDALSSRLHDLDAELRRSSPSFDNFIQKINKFADSSGAAFGRGSRNDLLNFFGSLTRNLINVGALLASAGRGVAVFVRGFGDVIRTGGGITGVFDHMLSSVGHLVPVLAGAALQVGTLVVVLGTLVSALSLATGWVVALAGSLSFALVGGLGVVVASFVPLIAMIGIAVAGFASMDKATKKAFDGVGEAAKGLGDIAANRLFKDAEEDAKALLGVIKTLEKPTRKLADATREVMQEWLKGLDSKAFTQFANFLGNTLPSMMTSLGDIFGNVAGALAGIWTAATPFVQEFLGWLAGVTQEFSDFANSATGQNKITAFFEDAKASLISVSGFLGDVWDLLTDLLDAGRGTGDSIFDSMGDAVEKFTDSLSGDELSEWFKDAEKFGEAVGDLIVGVGKLMDALDTPEMREFATVIVDVLGAALETLGDLVGPVISAIGILDDDLAALAITIGVVALAWPKFSGALTAMNAPISNFVTGVKDANTRMQTLKSTSATLAGPLGMGLVVDGATRAEGAMSILETTIGGALTGFAVSGGNPFGALIGGVGGGLIGVWKASKDAEKGLMSAEEAARISGEAAQISSGSWDNLAASLNQVTGARTKDTRAAISQEIQTTQMMDVARASGISTDLMTRAILGEKDAREQVTTATEIWASRGATLLSQAETALTDYHAEAMNMSGEEQAAEETRIEGLRAQGQAYIDAAAKAGEWLGAVGNAGEVLRNTAADVLPLDKMLKGLPAEVITYVRAGNIPQTFGEVSRIKGLFDNMDRKDVRTMIEAFWPDANEKRVNRFINRMAEAGDFEVSPHIEANVEEPVTDIEGMKRHLLDVNRSKTTANVKAEDSIFTDIIKGVNRALKAVNEYVANPKIEIDPTDANNAINGVTTGLDGINDEDVYIDVWTRHHDDGKGPGASGGMFYSATRMLIGEQGPEALVPLNRPLGQVDPAVRALSAFAQGLPVPGMQQQAVAGVNMGGVTIITPTEDPAAVAQEVVNRLVAVGY